MAMNQQRNILGFSFLEFVITTTILTIISSLTSAAVHHLKVANRNARRVADIVETQTGLEMYNRLAHQYPDVITPGNSLAYNDQVIMKKIPTNPQPRDDGACPDEEYSYLASSDQKSYTITFCISSRVGEVGPGNNTAKPGEIVSCLPNCVLSCDSDSDGQGTDGCGGYCSAMLATCPSGYNCYFDHCIKDI